MKTVVLDVYNEDVKVTEVEDKLEVFYRHLDCDVIDIVDRKIDGKWFDIVCDDEGLLKMNPKISAINGNGDPMLVGNLMFFHSKDGELTGLSEEDIVHIRENIHWMYTIQYPDGYPMLTECEYE